MSFFIQHRYGNTERDPSLSALPKLLRELDEDNNDSEHNSVALTHETEWNISALRGGYVIFENLEKGDPSHMRNVSESKIIELWTKLSAGKIQELHGEPWLPGC